MLQRVLIAEPVAASGPRRQQQVNSAAPRHVGARQAQAGDIIPLPLPLIKDDSQAEHPRACQAQAGGIIPRPPPPPALLLAPAQAQPRQLNAVQLGSGAFAASLMAMSAVAVPGVVVLAMPVQPKRTGRGVYLEPGQAAMTTPTPVTPPAPLEPDPLAGRAPEPQATRAPEHSSRQVAVAAAAAPAPAASSTSSFSFGAVKAVAATAGVGVGAGGAAPAVAESTAGVAGRRQHLTAGSSAATPGPPATTAQMLDNVNMHATPFSKCSKPTGRGR